jgi:hypothetical protein
MTDLPRNVLSRALASKAVESVAEKYRARGYQVLVEPRRSDVPSFLKGFRPDLIARRQGESVVVEVKVGTETSVAQRYRDLAEAIRTQPGWRFDLVVIKPGEGEPPAVDATLPTESELEGRLKQANELESAGSLDAAFIVLWLAVEGLMRLQAKRAGLPLERMPTSALVRELYFAGEIAREDYETALRLMETRNAVVHGFSAPVSRQELSELETIVEHLFAQLREVSG